MEIWGTRGNANGDGDEVRLFWTRYFTQELVALVDARLLKRSMRANVSMTSRRFSKWMEPCKHRFCERPIWPVYGARNRIETVPTALSMIGMDETRKIIVGRAMAELMRKVDQAGFDRRGFFLHSVSVGYLVQLLSLNMETPTPRHRELIDSLRIPPEVESIAGHHRINRVPCRVEAIGYEHPRPGGMDADPRQLALRMGARISANGVRLKN